MYYVLIKRCRKIYEQECDTNYSFLLKLIGPCIILIFE